MTQKIINYDDLDDFDLEGYKLQDAKRIIKISKVVKPFLKRLTKNLATLEQSFKLAKAKLLKNFVAEVFKKCQEKGIECTRKEIEEEWVVLTAN